MFVADYESENFKGLIGPFDTREEADEYCISLHSDSSWTVVPVYQPE